MRQADVAVIAGDRRGRVLASLRWLVQRGMGSVDAVYVESATSAATPFDLVFLGWARIRGRPVGVFFRDAHQRFRHLYPIFRRRQALADFIWRASMPLLRGIASVAFCPSSGLARVLEIRDAVLLPPGTDPAMPFVGAGHEELIAAVTSFTEADGTPLLLRVATRLRERRPGLRLLLVGGNGERPRGLPEWVEVQSGGRGDLARLLAPARVCVISLRRTPYTDLAIPVRLMDYLALGKPLVVTRLTETEAIVGPSRAALIADDEDSELAAAIERVLDDSDLALGLSTRARRLAEADDMVWDARARRILENLVGVTPAVASARPPE